MYLLSLGPRAYHSDSDSCYNKNRFTKKNSKDVPFYSRIFNLKSEDDSILHSHQELWRERFHNSLIMSDRAFKASWKIPSLLKWMHVKHLHLMKSKIKTLVTVIFTLQTWFQKFKFIHHNIRVTFKDRHDESICITLNPERKITYFFVKRWTFYQNIAFSRYF